MYFFTELYICWSDCWAKCSVEKVSCQCIGDHQSTQLFLSKTKQRYLFAWKKVSVAWQQVNSNWQSLACPSLFMCHRFTRLSESVSFFNEASVVGNLKTNASNNCWFKLKAVFGWRCEKQLWKFMLVGPPFKHRGLQRGAPFHLQRNRRFLLKRWALRCQRAAPR